MLREAGERWIGPCLREDRGIALGDGAASIALKGTGDHRCSASGLSGIDCRVEELDQVVR